MRLCTVILLWLMLPMCSTGQTWRPLNGDTLDGGAMITRLHTTDTGLVAAGGFQVSTAVNSMGAAIYNGVNWDTLGLGAPGGTDAIVPYQGNLYFGGWFNNAGGNSDADDIAYWNGVWNDLCGGLPTEAVRGLAKYQGNLYLTGNFSQQCSVPDLYNICSWDGNQIQPVSGGLIGGVALGFDLCVYEDKLIAAGHFNWAGNTNNPANYIASWDGNQWEEVGNGLNEYAGALVVDTVNEYLYVSGGFTMTGDLTPVSYLARWDGQAWYDVGGGTGPCTASTLCLYRNQLYGGGCFVTAGGKPIEYIARFDGYEWDSLGSGTNNTVASLAEYEDELYVGGSFSSAGDSSTNLIARWHLPWDSVCATMYAGIAPHPDTLYLGDLPYTFRSGCYGNNGLSWAFSGGYTDSTGHTDQDFNYNPGVYDIRLIATCGNGSSDTAWSSVVVVSDLGVDGSRAEDGVKVYPNPTGGVFVIETSHRIESVEVIDGSGRQVVYTSMPREEGSRLEVGLNNHPPGVYYLHIQTDVGAVRRKVVKR